MGLLVKFKLVTTSKTNLLTALQSMDIPKDKINYLESIISEGTIILGVPCGNQNYISQEINDAIKRMNHKLVYINDSNLHSNTRFYIIKFCINPSLIHLIRQFYDSKLTKTLMTASTTA